MVLLWWPAFFPTDSVTTWLLRGIAWTLSFELLLVALSPLELALWSTGRGERLTRRVEAGRALLEHDSTPRRIGRRAVLACGALAVPLALIALGVSSHIPGPPAAVAEVTRVTRVVRVVKPVRVERVVSVRTVEAPAASGAPVNAQPARQAPARRPAATRRVVRKPAPVPRSPASKPAPAPHTAPTTPAPTSSQPADGATQPSAPSATPVASGSQTS